MADNLKKLIADQYENNSIYVLLSSRGALSGFHWGIFIPTNTPYGFVWHASNKEGGWHLVHKKSDTVPFSLSLLLARKIGTVNSKTWETCYNTLSLVPCSGQPSSYTGEEFSCRVWVKDAILELQKNKVIDLPEAISSIEKELMERAAEFKLGVERGTETAQVDN